MSPSSTGPKTEYVPLASHPDGEYLESSNDDEVLPSHTSNKSSGAPSYILWGFIVVACLSAFNTILLPLTLKAYANTPLSRSELDKLPWPDTHLGLDRAAKKIPPMPVFHFAWPDKIARVSHKLKNSVFGDGKQVFISVEDSTIMRFPIPPHGTSACALTFHPPPEHSPRAKDLETKGDISEIEAWSIIAPSRLAHSPSNSPSSIDFDTLSWNTLPVRGELLGTLDLTARPNTTTVEFACPADSKTLTVEFRCLRVACHVKFLQVKDMVPKLGFEFVRRHK